MISDKKIEKNSIIYLYHNKKFSMAEIAKLYKVSLNSIVSFMRKNKIKRRSKKESRLIRFNKAPKSFVKKEINNNFLKELSIVGAMLYWGEGYKGSVKNNTLDFANSDPVMVSVFINFLRKIYVFDEKRLKIFLYCYSDQKVNQLINFWSRLLGVNKKNFTKPYIKKDSLSSKKMKYGLVHIRYSDKKMLLDIKNMIECYSKKYMRRSDSGYSSGL